MTPHTSRFSWLAAATLATLLLIPVAAERPQAQEKAPPVHAITWLDQREAIEQWLREAPVERSEEIPVGVTKPTRIFFGGNGPARSAAWKPILPSIYSGFRESYKSEIAAYELDKMLGLDMVPPTVERRMRGARGAVIMWVEGVTPWEPKMTVIAPNPIEWSRQVSRMRLFDWFVANIDRNAGNILQDEDYHIVLIDHSRAFTTTTDLRRMGTPTRIDSRLWDKIQALTLEDLQAGLGEWVGRAELQAMLRRRDRMKTQIDEMVKTRGESVFIQ